MLADDRVAGFAVLSTALAGVPDGELVAVSSYETVRGSLGWTMLEGRMPKTPDEVAVGPRLARRRNLEVGGVMEFASPSSGAGLPKAVVGIGIGPIASNAPFGDHAVLTPAGFANVARTQAFTEGYIRLAEGVDLEAFADEIGASAELSLREPPPEVRNLGGLGRLPDLLAGILTLIAVSAVVNALVVGVRRRRHDIAILRALGFVRSQVARAVRTSALAMTVTSLIGGIAFGLIVGRSLWRLVATTAYVAGDAAWPAAILVGIGPAAVVFALASAGFPAAHAARLDPAEILHAE